MIRIIATSRHFQRFMLNAYALLFTVMKITSGHAQSSWKILPNAPALENGRYEDIYFVSESTGWAVAFNGTIIKTTDGGSSWQTQFQEAGKGFRSIAFADSLRGWAGTIHGQLFQTTDGGLHWIRIDTLIVPEPAGVCDLSVVSDSVVFGSGRWSGPTNIIKSTNGGASWENKSIDEQAFLLIGCKFFTKKSGFVVGASTIASEGGVVLFTSDGGMTWENRHKTMRNNEHIWNIVFATPRVGYATVQNPLSLDTIAVIKTSDGGLTWQRKTVAAGSLPFRYAESIGFATDKKGWIGSGVGTGMYETLDGGNTWKYLNIGSKIHGFHIMNDSVGYACGATIYKYSPGTTAVNVRQEVAPLPSYRLKQNYPNPFNTATQIRYRLPSRSFVWLNIYNLEGKLMWTLQRGYQEAGDHNIVWQAGNLPSGVYIYSLRTDEGIFVGKAMLIK